MAALTAEGARLLLVLVLKGNPSRGVKVTWLSQNYEPIPADGGL